MKKFLTLFFFCHAVSSGISKELYTTPIVIVLNKPAWRWRNDGGLYGKHSLEYFLTSTSGTTNSTEFLVTATVDDVEIAYCDSIIKRAEPRHQHWLGELIENDPYHFKMYSQLCFDYQQDFKSYINVFKHHLNQTEGSHVLQGRFGCELDAESGEVKAFNQFGYDGEDFISLDMQNEMWIAQRAEAVEIKRLWDLDKKRIDNIKGYYMAGCPTILQDYMRYGSFFLQKIVYPTVFLLQKTPSSPVSCHATGFYPHKADLFWRKDGEEIHEYVEKGQILPNHDETFQMTTKLIVSAVPQEDWNRYECVFQLSGLKKDIITMLKKAKIHGNWEFSVHHHAVGVIATGVLLLVLGGVLYWCWRERNDFQPMQDDLE